MSQLRISKRQSGAFLTESHRRAPKQEAEMAKRLGGQRVAMSGAGDTKGDVRLKGVCRVECKNTKHDSFRVTAEMMKKIEDAAIGTDEIPVICVELPGGVEAAVMPVWAVESLLGGKESWRCYKD